MCWKSNSQGCGYLINRSHVTCTLPRRYSLWKNERPPEHSFPAFLRLASIYGSDPLEPSSLLPPLSHFPASPTRKRKRKELSHGFDVIPLNLCSSFSNVFRGLNSVFQHFRTDRSGITRLSQFNNFDLFVNLNIYIFNEQLT